MKNSQKTSLYKWGKRLAIGSIVTAGLAFGGFFYGNAVPSDSITRHLKNPNPFCYSIPDYAPLQFIHEYKKDIAESSQKNNASPEMIAAVIISHNSNRPKYEDWKDFWATGKTGYVWNTYFAPWTVYIHKSLDRKDPSLGPNQIKVGTAAMLDGYSKINQSVREKLEKRLKDPVINIQYAARALAKLASRENRKPKSINILDDPHALGVLLTEFGKGKSGNDLNTARSSMEHGVNSLIPLAQWDLRGLLGEPFSINKRQRREIADYIEQRAREDGLKISISIDDPKVRRLEELCFK